MLGDFFPQTLLRLLRGFHIGPYLFRWSQSRAVVLFMSFFASLDACAAELPTVTTRLLFDYGNLDGRDTAFGTEDFIVRQARIGLDGTVFNGVKYKVSVTSDDAGDVSLSDAYIEFAATNVPGKIRIGNFKTPVSLDETISQRFVSVHERAGFTDAFSFGRRLGIGLQNAQERYTFAFGAFTSNIEAPETFGSYAFVGRYTFVPIVQDDFKLQVGTSARYRREDEDLDLLRFRQRPFSQVSNRILSTGRFARSDTFVGVEAAATKGSAWTAGEFATTFANCETCTDDPIFTGGYFEVGYVFGGTRDLSKGRFANPTITNSVLENGLGAVSIAARFDTLDLTDGDIDGGSYDAFILGADWWPTERIRLGINLFQVNTDLGLSDAGLDSVINEAILLGATEERIRGLSLRAQIGF